MRVDCDAEFNSKTAATAQFRQTAATCWSVKNRRVDAVQPAGATIEVIGPYDLDAIGNPAHEAIDVNFTIRVPVLPAPVNSAHPFQVCIR